LIPSQRIHLMEKVWIGAAARSYRQGFGEEAPGFDD
jgi:hypothetical protein